MIIRWSQPRRVRLHASAVGVILLITVSFSLQDDPARLTVRPDHSTVAEESPINFFCKSDGNPLPTVHWRVNGKGVPDSRYKIISSPSGLSTLRIDSVQSGDNNTLISCSADNGIANPIHAEATLTVVEKKELPVGFPRIEGHPSIKAVEHGRTAHVTCRVDGEPRPKVLWLRDNVPVDIRANDRYSVATLTNPGALMIQLAREEDQGRYECVARNAHGVQHSRAAQLYVKVRRVPPYFSYKLEKSYKVGVGGSINLTCVAVGYPMPRVLWRKSDEPTPPVEVFDSAPVGRNILTLSNVESTENYSCMALSKLGNIEATTTVFVKPMPAAPVNLRITAVTSSSVSLAWDPVAETEDEPITKHVVKYRLKSSSRVTTTVLPISIGEGVEQPEYGDSSKWKEHVVDASERVATVEGLDPFTLYEFVVQSHNEIGGGSLTHPREAQTDEDVPAGPPLKVQAKGYLSSGLVVQWLPPDVPNGYITNYLVYYTNEEVKTPLDKWKKHDTKSDERTTTIRDLLSDKQYYVLVKAVNTKGQSAPSKIVPVKTTNGLPGQVIGLISSPLDGTRIQLNWDKPIHTMPITGYTIVHNSTEGEKEFKLTSPHEKHIVRDLKPTTTYSFRIAAQSSRGKGELSDSTIVTTLNGTAVSQSAAEQDNVPSAPRSLKVELVSPTEVKLTWDPPLHENGQLRGYYVYKERLENGVPVSGQLQKALSIMDAKKLHAVVDGLEPNREYSFRVNAFNRNGDGEFSESRSIVTGGIPPRKPEIIGVALDSPHDQFPLSARINWKQPSLESLDAPIDKYHIWYRPSSQSTFRHETIPASETGTTIGGLWMGEEYQILLGAENGEGLSANATEQLVTPVGAPDAEPADVQYEIIGTHKMKLYWNPPVEDKRNGKITGYKAILTAMDRDTDDRGNKIKTRQEQEVTKSFAIFNVEPNLSYTFKVAASTMKGQGPYSPVLTINPDPSALVGPPTNVRVEPISNSTAVVQWEYPTSEPVDGFVVKYIHEPTSRSSSETWHQKKIMTPDARDFAIDDLAYPHKPYAFCVLAVKQNRQGPCSEPPTVVERIHPKFYATNLQVEWKTHNSVKVKWEYHGPGPVTFRLNATGRKEYLDQHLEMRSLHAPGAARDLDHNIKSYLFHSLRAAMNYELKISVVSGTEEHWANKVMVWTDPQAPAVIETPMVDQGRVVNGMARIRLRPCSEEYGAISHYWIIVVPGNYTRDTIMHLDNAGLVQTSKEKRQKVTSNVSITPAKKMKRAREGEEADEEGERKRRKREDSSLEPVSLPSSSPIRRHRSLPTLNGPYITAEISANEMRDTFKSDDFFTIGDDNTHGSFINFKLENDKQYKVFMRAFAKPPEKRSQLEQRAPMMENSHKLWGDSDISEPFTPKSTGMVGRGPSSGAVWMLGPLIALLAIFLFIGLLVWWFMRCRNKSVGRGSMRHHGSITKVALGGHHHHNGNGMIGETSKLLNTDYGRMTVMNPYDQMNGNNSASLDHLYPLSSSQSRQYAHNGNGNMYTTMPRLPSSGGPTGGHSLSHPPVPITQLATHIERLRANNNAGFVQEFESIETGQVFTWDASSADYNKHKNRYANIPAYDHSRVVLNGQAGNDYINANYIDGYERQRTYIATQGPLPETFDDFWRMVWEEDSRTIVMLTNLEEQNRMKCDQYWPSRGTAIYGDIEVTVLETIQLAHYTTRTMRIQAPGEIEREVHHLQYTAWPDHGVPDHPTPFLIFLKRVRTLNPPEAGPIISHCSAGVGRTGAFIVIDIMLERLRYDHTIDIFGCVTALRSQRSHMVQIDEQYMFIHDAVLDAVLSGSTEVPAKRLSQHLSALLTAAVDGVNPLEAEFRQLNTFRMRDARAIDANTPVNRHKNRSMAVVPYDANRVKLSNVPGIEGSDYINASWVDGYRERCAYIATQAPNDQTITDFWRMIWENECGIIVVLKMGYDGVSGRDNSQSRLEYWPQEHGVQCGTLVIEPIAEYDMTTYIVREFKISDVQSQISRTVRHFEYTDWPEINPAPKSADLFIDFVQQIHKTKPQFGVDGPIVVHCSTGAGRTGVFIALGQIIDRIKLEGVVDVFTTVKVLRTERQGSVQECDQYHFLYLAAREFINNL